MGDLALPRYRSHKTVSALEIACTGSVSAAGQPLFIYFTDIDYPPVEADPDMFARYTPVPGDFYVVYPDGYKAISPRKAFLEGYDKI